VFFKKTKQIFSIIVSVTKTLFIIKRLHVFKAVTIILPHQLFKNHPAVSAGRKIFLVGGMAFFSSIYVYKTKAGVA